jgi:hypothetical protein
MFPPALIDPSVVVSVPAEERFTFPDEAVVSVTLNNQILALRVAP